MGGENLGLVKNQPRYSTYVVVMGRANDRFGVLQTCGVPQTCRSCAGIEHDTDEPQTAQIGQCFLQEPRAST